MKLAKLSLCIVLLSPASVGDPTLTIEAWNRLAQQYNAGSNVLVEIERSLRARPPNKVLTRDRVPLYERAIAHTRRQLKELETLRDLEK